jgi:hypothetical protein
MKLLIVLFGLLIAAGSVWGLVAPRAMIDAIHRFWNRPEGMWLAVGMRVAGGLIFVFGASQTRFPLFYEVLGYLMLVAAVLIPLIGKARLTRVIRWFTDVPLPAARTWMSLGLAFALFVVYGAI